ncbi:MAG TPA: hypothetical protein VNR18_02145, partial [Hyphomicrobiales bacterium]|nr:hypothetical protein [Hyphomicrobiales bacterium]
MPEYLAPGVFVEEVSFRGKSIEGVGTSVAGLVGPTRTGPLRGKPELLTSFADFVRIYGDANDLVLGGTAVLNHTAIAAKAFFDGGGSKLYVARTAGDVNSTDAYSAGSSAQIASSTDANGAIAFTSRFPGEAGNYTLELRWRDAENLLKFETLGYPDDGEEVFLSATGLGSTVRDEDIADRVPNERFPLSFRGIVRREGDDFVIVNNLCEITAADDEATTSADFRPSGAEADAEGVLLGEALVNGATTTISFVRVSARTPANGALAASTPAVLRFNG